MKTFEIKLDLPDNLASEAEARGLLTSDSIESLLMEALRQRRIDDLFEAMDKVASPDKPLLTEAEIEAEIHALREERRHPDTNRC